MKGQTPVDICPFYYSPLFVTAQIVQRNSRQQNVEKTIFYQSFRYFLNILSVARETANFRSTTRHDDVFTRIYAAFTSTSFPGFCTAKCKRGFVTCPKKILLPNHTPCAHYFTSGDSLYRWKKKTEGVKRLLRPPSRSFVFNVLSSRARTSRTLYFDTFTIGSIIHWH